MNPEKLILVTNDDSVSAKGIHSLTKNRVGNQHYLAGKGKRKKLTQLSQGDLKRKGL